MTKTELVWLAQNMRCAQEERIKIWELSDPCHARLLGRDSSGNIRTWVLRASLCYKRMALVWGYGGNL